MEQADSLDGGCQLEPAEERDGLTVAAHLARKRLMAGQQLDDDLDLRAVTAPALGLAAPAGLPAQEAAIDHGLTWLVSDLAEAQPLVIVVDDVQWADPASAAWLCHLARRVGDLPVLLLLAARPAVPAAEAPGLATLRELPELERLRPGPLDRASVAALVRSFYAPDAEEAFVATCHRAAGGNPFHTHALLDAAATRDLPATAAGAQTLAQLAPEAVRHSVAAGLRRAGNEAQALARACALLGEQVELRHAAALAGADIARAEAAADRLAGQNLLTGERPLRFVHPVLRAAVRDQMPAGERAMLHRQAGRLLEAEGDMARAGAHMLEVAPVGDADACRTLVAAADAAAATGAMTSAVGLLERALTEPPPPQERPLILARLGRARMWASLPGAVGPLVAAARTLDADTAAQLLATAVWGTVWGEGERLGELTAYALALAPGDGEGRMRLDAALATTRAWYGLELHAPADELIARAEPLAGASPAERELLGAAAFVGALTGTLPAGRQLSLARRALLTPGDTPAPATICALLVGALAGMPEEVLAAADTAIAGSRRRGNHTGAIGMHSARALCELRVGRLREAELNARLQWDAVRDADRSGVMWSYTLAGLVFVLAARGLLAEGRTLADTGRAARGLPPFPGALVSFAAGVIALEAGDAAAAAEAFLALEEALSVRGILALPWLPGHRAFAVEALIRLGDVDAARALAEKELRLARRLGAPGPLGFATRSMGLVAGGAEGLTLLHEAVSLLERAGDTERLARTLVDLGRALRLDGRPTDAREPLRRAHRLADECGAERVAQVAFDELRAAGAKPRRRAPSGPASLTASEARVARLAAGGLTNREIAQSLFVSSKTVETHLGHIYGKLGIGGRSELAGAITGTS